MKAPTNSRPHLIENPTVIDLSELPLEGRSLVFSSESGELTEVLRDLLGSHRHTIEVLVKPLGNIFEASGTIVSQMQLQCSLCGDDLTRPLNMQFRELLMVMDPLSRDSHASRVNHTSELNLDAPEVTELENPEFDIGEFVHELIAISVPIRITARPDCETDCENYQRLLASGLLNSRDTPGFQNVGPFASLKGLKLNR